MSNELLWLLFLAVDLAVVVAAHRLFGKAGHEDVPRRATKAGSINRQLEEQANVYSSP